MINFKELNVDRVCGRYNQGKAPHKAVLLLSVIKLYENNKINLKKIELNNSELFEVYKTIWNCLDYDKTGSIHLPLYHLQSDGFYRLQKKNINSPFIPVKSFKKLLEQSEFAEFNDEFIELMNTENSRKKIIEEIIMGGYFTIHEISKLNSTLNFLDKSFEYEKILRKESKNEFGGNYLKEQTEKFQNYRSDAFRRVVLSSYNSTCAICRASLLVQNTSIVDAAHIMPFSEFANDNPRNGIALCKNHHWLFDNGAISISTDYRIKISNNIQNEAPDGILSQYFRKKILLPDDIQFFPAKEALTWHNHKWGFI